MIALREKQYGKQFCSIEPMTMMMLGGGASNIGGSLFGGLMGSGAEKKRAAALKAAGEQGATEIMAYTKLANQRAREYGDMARGDLSPFREIGVRAGTTLADLLMGGKDLGAMLKESDLFKFQSDLGSRNINRELAARGLYGSGAGLETLARFNNHLVAEEGQRFTDRLANLTSLGANTATSMAQGALHTGDVISGNVLRGGTAAAEMRFNAATGAANASANGTRMLADMGQNIFGQVGQGFAQYGNYMLNKPILDSLITRNGGMTSGDAALAQKHGLSLG